MTRYILRDLRILSAVLQVFIALPPQQNGRRSKADQAHRGKDAGGGEERFEIVVIEDVVEQVRDLLRRIEQTQHRCALGDQSRSTAWRTNRTVRRTMTTCRRSPCTAPAWRRLESSAARQATCRNALAANEAMRHAPTPAHSRPPNEI